MSKENSKKSWSRQHEKCISCGTTDFRHVARGLCLKCYQTKQTEDERQTRKINRHGWDSHFSKDTMTYDYLLTEYVNSQKSLADIATACHCSRQMVYKLLKRYNIPIRDKGEARQLAHEKGKVVFRRTDKNGQETNVVAERIRVNQEFFSKWSPEMAYVLGVICTDGNLSIPHIKDIRYKISGGIRIKRITLSQKEPELLEKVLKLMDSNSKLLFSPRRQYNGVISGERYYFHIHHDRIFDDLISLGLTPNKSRTLKFPSVPDEYLRDFIRGCWDGDGSVSVYQDATHTKHPMRIIARFTSGSKHFIKEMAERLRRAGFKQRNILKDGVRSYCISFAGTKFCRALYEYLYKDVQPNLFLERKFNLFVKYFGRLDDNIQSENPHNFGGTRCVNQQRTHYGH